MAKAGFFLTLLLFMGDIRSDLTLKKSNFLFPLNFKIADTSLFECVRHNFFSSHLNVTFGAFSVFTGNKIRCKVVCN